MNYGIVYKRPLKYLFRSLKNKQNPNNQNQTDTPRMLPLPAKKPSTQHADPSDRNLGHNHFVPTHVQAGKNQTTAYTDGYWNSEDEELLMGLCGYSCRPGLIWLLQSKYKDQKDKKNQSHVNMNYSAKFRQGGEVT